MKRLVFFRQLTFSALLTLLIFSCTKEISPIGIGLVDEQDLLGMGYTDSVQIVAYSIIEDSIYTRNLGNNTSFYVQAGSMYDPIFGRTTANFYSQLFLSKKARFGTSPVFDSAFLYLPYVSSYGDTLSNMTLRVYALTDSIVDSLHSYSNRTISYNQANPLGEITFQPRPASNSYYGGSKQDPILRIPINHIFADSIFSITDTTLLNSNIAFKKAFKGICIIAEPQTISGKGAILTFSSPNSGYMGLQMFYHNTEDTTSFTFKISSDCSRFQNYDHNGYAEAIPVLREQILNHNKELGKEFLFAQGFGGVKIMIKFPFLDKWNDRGKIVINDAQLFFGNASVSDVFRNPTQLTLRTVGENGSSNALSIVDDDGEGYFDGIYNEASNSYRFRLTRYIQQVLSGKANNNGIHLLIPGASYVANRLVLNGTSSPQSDLKLYVRYTKLK